VDAGNKTRGPLLLTAGGRDRTVPHAVTTAARRLYHKSPAVTDLREFPDRGHTLTIDHGWREVAQVVMDWLGRARCDRGKRQPGAATQPRRGRPGHPGGPGGIRRLTEC
jgi:hypothetical protein